MTTNQDAMEQALAFVCSIRDMLWEHRYDSSPQFENTHQKLRDHLGIDDNETTIDYVNGIIEELVHAIDGAPYTPPKGCDTLERPPY